MNEPVTRHTNISSDEMLASGFSWDPTFSGHERWTHIARDITVVRQPYMTDAQWEDAKRTAVARAHVSDEEQP